jgi:multiple sugar transport system substrate-binding protein
MKFKRVCVLLVIMIVITNVLTGCDKESAAVDKKKAESKPTLSIYYLKDQISAYLSNACSEYKTLYPGVQLNEKVFDGQELKGIEEFQRKITSEIAAGEGPDIIVSNVYNPLNVNMWMNKGVFTDLNESIKADKEFNIKDYNETVMNCGVIKGKRFVVPIYYQTSLLVTSKGILKKNGINIDENNFSWVDLSKIAEKYSQNGGKAPKLLGGLYWPQFINESGLTLVDYESKKSMCNSPEFKNLLEAYKKIYLEMCQSDVIQKYENGNFGLIKENQAVIECDTLGQCLSPFSLSLRNSMYKTEIGEDMLVIKPKSTYGEKGFYAEAGDVVGINAKCKYKKEAFDFIKYLISEKFQQQIPGINLPGIPGISVNKKAYQKDKEWALVQYNPGYLLTKDEGDRIDNINNNISKCNIIDSDILDITGREIKGYLDGKTDIDQVLKIINDKINIYLNE